MIGLGTYTNFEQTINPHYVFGQHDTFRKMNIKGRIFAMFWLNANKYSCRRGNQFNNAIE